MPKNSISSLITCSECKGQLENTGSAYECNNCKKTAPIKDNKIYFFQAEENTSSDSGDSILNAKEYLKNKFPSLYPTLVRLISPVQIVSDFDEWLLKDVNPANDVVLNLGSGCDNHHPEIINVDITPYENVDLIADIEKLPIKSDSVDCIVSVAVLEHVRRPSVVVDEMRRVLKKGGTVRCMIPFMQGIHASPHDYQRYTPSGLKELYKDFSDIEVTIASGPMSGFVWMLQEFFATFFSFGSKKLYLLLYYIGFIFTPLKFLDIFYAKHSMAENIASGFKIKASKI